MHSVKLLGTLMNKAHQRLIYFILAAVWINVSEFFRNELLLKCFWESHFKMLGIAFPSTTVNNFLWVLWCFIFTVLIDQISKKFTILKTTLISWGFAFPMMWIVIYNLNVMPTKIITLAIPLSLLETFIAAKILEKKHTRL